MMTTSSTVNELLDLLSQLKTEEAAILREVEDRLEDVRRKIAAVQTTLELLPRDAEAPKPVSTNGWAQKLHGKTQAEALVEIARENDGILRVTDAKRIFIGTGISKGKPKYLSGHIYHTLERSERWERVAPGTFKLLEARPAGGNGGAFLLPS